jgi:hypothetical protein
MPWRQTEPWSPKPILLLYRDGTLTRLDAGHRRRREGRGREALDLGEKREELEVDESGLRCTLEDLKKKN